MTNDNSDPIRLHIDGPNLDMTLANVLGRKPLPHERPRWNRLLAAVRPYGVERASFVFNGDRFGLHVTGLYRSLRSWGFDTATPRSRDWCSGLGQDPVDCWIQQALRRQIAEIRNGTLAGVMLSSHDKGYVPFLKEILQAGGKVYIVGFWEWMPPELLALQAIGAVILDIEEDLGGFDSRLDRPGRAA